MTQKKESALTTGRGNGKDIIAHSEEEYELLTYCFAFPESTAALRPFTRPLTTFGRELISEIVSGGTGARALLTLPEEQRGAFIARSELPSNFLVEYYEYFLRNLLHDGYTFAELKGEFAKITAKSGTRRAQIKPVTELMAREFDPARWIIDGLIPEGLTFLVGKPKIGKSWFVLDTALHAAQGKTFIGYETEKSKVLYYALEDSERRLNNRIGKLGGIKDAENFYYSCSLEPLTEGCIDQIEENLSAGFKLIIIDTYARIKTATKRDAYAEETQALAGLQRLALAYQSAIILVHHSRKNTESTDLYDQVLGSQALTGTADSSIILERDRKTHRIILNQTGRDIEDKRIAIDFDVDDERVSFEFAGNADEVQLSETATVIVDHLKKTELHLTPPEIAQALNLKTSTVKGTCYRLWERVEILKEENRQRYYYDKAKKYKNE